MPIQSTKTTTIPGLAAPTTPDLVGYEIHTNLTFPATGVTGSGFVKIQPYRANADGTNPTPIGQSQMLVSIPDLFAKAASDAAGGNTQLATILTAIASYVQTLVTAQGK